MSALTIDSVITVPTAGRDRSRHLVAVPAPVAAPSQGSLRLTRRGRLAITLVVALLLAVVAVVGARAAWATPSVQTPATQTVTVLPGQTLWEIAGASAAGDPRDAVIEIRELNGLPDSQVYAGQVLLVPAG
jgi:hypothetical protein